MLTKEQKAEAELKLKMMNEERTQEQQLKNNIKKINKSIIDQISSLKGDPKQQLQLLKKLANEELPAKISLFERTNLALTDAQERMKNEKEKLSKDSLYLLEEKGRFENGIEQIKKTIKNIQKTVEESVKDQAKKRAQIEDNLEKSLEQIRAKIKQFTAQTENFDKENAEMQTKIAQLKEKLGGIEENYKVKAEEKDAQVKGEKQELTNKLKQLEVEVESATQMSKEYTALQKKNFDNKIAVYLKTKKFPELSSSFQSSANTLNSCKLELQKGVQRMNTASETIQKYNAQAEQINKQFLAELRKQKEKESKIEEIKKEKEAVRANIIVLQNKLKEKKAKA